MTDKKRTVPAAISAWTESELLYFPRSPRVVVGAESDPMLESSIQQHFSNVAVEHGISKLELAKLARFEGIKLASLMDNGVDLSDKEVNAIIKEQDETRRQATPRVIRRAEDVTGPMVSYDDISNTEAPESRSAFKPGLFIIYGGADASKSHRLKKLYDYTAQNLKGLGFSYEYLIMGEPDHRSLGSWRETIATLRYGIIRDGDVYVPDVIFLDSLKDLLYMPGDSGSGSGGLSTSAIMELSSISSQLMRDGRTVIAVINPSQPKYLKDMYETLKSNVTGIFFYNVPNSDRDDRRDHFTPAAVRNMISSFRAWNQEYYDRISDQGIMNLVGLEGDILDQTTQAIQQQESKRVSIRKSRAAIAGNLKDRMKLFLVGSTPANKE